MIKPLISIFLICLVLLNSSIVHGAAPKPPPLPEVTEFESIPVETVVDNKVYVGILLSEEEYVKYTDLKGKYSLLRDKLYIIDHYDFKYEQLMLDQQKNAVEVVKNIKNLRKDMKTTWWDDLKFPIGIGLGILTTVLVVYGVNQIK